MTDQQKLTDERIAVLARKYLSRMKRPFYTKWKDGIDIDYPVLEIEQFARAIEAELSRQAQPVACIERLQRENDTLRGLLGNSAKPCPYCGLAAEDQSKCERGFPGCDRADDQMLGKYSVTDQQKLTDERIDEIFDAFQEAPTMEFRYLVARAIEAELSARQAQLVAWCDPHDVYEDRVIFYGASHRWVAEQHEKGRSLRYTMPLYAVPPHQPAGASLLWRG